MHEKKRPSYTSRVLGAATLVVAGFAAGCDRNPGEMSETGQSLNASNVTIDSIIERLQLLEHQVKVFNKGQGLDNWVSEQIEKSAKLKEAYANEIGPREIVPAFKAIEQNLREGNLQEAHKHLMASFEQMGGFMDNMLMYSPDFAEESNKVGGELTGMISTYDLALQVQRLMAPAKTSSGPMTR